MPTKQNTHTHEIKISKYFWKRANNGFDCYLWGNFCYIALDTLAIALLTELCAHRVFFVLLHYHHTCWFVWDISHSSTKTDGHRLEDTGCPPLHTFISGLVFNLFLLPHVPPLGSLPGWNPSCLWLSLSLVPTGLRQYMLTHQQYWARRQGDISWQVFMGNTTLPAPNLVLWSPSAMSLLPAFISQQQRQASVPICSQRFPSTPGSSPRLPMKLGCPTATSSVPKVTLSWALWQNTLFGSPLVSYVRDLCSWFLV